MNQEPTGWNAAIEQARMETDPQKLLSLVERLFREMENAGVDSSPISTERPYAALRPYKHAA
jgi:hypothetical protein